MQHILIPTDFSIKSLNAIHTVATKYAGEKVKVSLFHLLQPEHDITQLFRSRRNMHMNMVTEEFREACQILQNRYSSTIAFMLVEFGFGNTTNYLGNLLEGLNVNTVFVCNDIEYHYTNKRSINPLPLLKKTGIKIETIALSYMKAQKSSTGKLPIKELLIPKEESYAVTK